MIKFKFLLISCLLIPLPVFSQTNFIWNELNFNLPSGIKVFEGIAAGPVHAFYADVDLTKMTFEVKVLMPKVKGTLSKTSETAKINNALLAVNGGFFSGTQSVSLAVSDSTLLAKQIASVSRPAGTYYLTRSAFGISKFRGYAFDWIYHFGDNLSDIYSFSDPISNTQNQPATQPIKAPPGIEWGKFPNAIGGGPMLMKNGIINITYNEEVFFGSGVGADNSDPRTAIGMTPVNHLIMFVVDGRKPAVSVGLNLNDLAITMKKLGCTNAMNLDGGGSSTFYAAGSVLNSPSDGTERSVASIVSIKKSPVYEKIYDASISKNYYREYGKYWIENMTPGYFGDKTRVRLINTGGSAVFYLDVNKKGHYEIYAYWTSFSNGAKDTPFIISVSGVKDTVRVDQSSPDTWGTWIKLGEYDFSGSGQDSIYISDQATGPLGTIVCVDALKVISFDETLLKIQEKRINIAKPDEFEIDIFPNPFNSRINFRFILPQESNASLVIYDLLGRVIEVLLNRKLERGEHTAYFNPVNLNSGIYFYKFKAGKYFSTGKMIYQK